MADRLSPTCNRLVVAGSVRREKAECGDLEIVCIPDGMRLDHLLGQWLSEHKITHVQPRQRWGPKLKSFTFVTSMGQPVQVDVFIQTPDTWGINLMIRTGSAVFSQRMVTARSRGGFMPDGYQVEDARAKAVDTLLDTSEEEHVFRLWGIDFPPPTQRTDDYKPHLGEPPLLELAPTTLFDLGQPKRKVSY